MPLGTVFPGNGNTKFTPEGGLAVKRINKTGGASMKGYIVEPSSSIDNGVKYTDNGDPDPIGIVYESGVPDGEEMWVIVSGIADVYYGTSVDRATFGRVPILADGLSTGQALAEPLPTSPFATDKHFQEIGHPMETRATPGLAKTVIHFN